MSTWSVTPLQAAMSSLDLHRRIVSLGIDGSLYYGTGTGAFDDSVPGAFHESNATRSSGAVPPQPTRTPSMCAPGTRHYTGDAIVFLQRAILWRIYLRILPFPYNATSFENITESWLEVLLKQRAWYSNMRQTFFEKYPDLANATIVPETPSDAPNAAAPGRPPPSGDEDPSSFASSARRAASGVFHKLKRQNNGNDSAPQQLPPSSSSEALNDEIDDEPAPKPKTISDDIIALDIRRSYLASDADVPHDDLYQILAVWRYLNPMIGYHQGMHEVAGNCLALMHRAASGVAQLRRGHQEEGDSEGLPEVIAQCATREWAEADAFVLFDTIMVHFGLGELFMASHVLHQRPQQLSSRPAPVPGDGPAEFADMDDDNISQLEAVCRYVVHGLLKDHSNLLYHHLGNTGMLDQVLLFMPRWIRNLFTREVSIAQVFVVWDGIFSVYYSELMVRVMKNVSEGGPSAESEGRAGSEEGEGGGGVFSVFKRFRKPAAAVPKKAGSAASSRDLSEFSTRSVGALDVPQRGSFGSIPDDAFDDTRASASSAPVIPGGKEPARAASPGAALPQTPLTVLGTSPVGNVVYAGQEPRKGMKARRRDPTADPAALVDGTPGMGACFSRTVAGIAAVLLMFVEDDLLATEDDFAILKLLTKTPLIPPTVDPVIIVSKAMALARTRPPGVVRYTCRRSFRAASRISFKRGMGGLGDDATALGRRPSTRKSNFDEGRLIATDDDEDEFAAKKQNALLSKEELLLQQQSVALVLRGVVVRLTDLMEKGKTSAANANDAARTRSLARSLIRKSVAPGKEEAAPAVVMNEEEAAILESSLQELEHLARKLI